MEMPTVYNFKKLTRKYFSDFKVCEDFKMRGVYIDIKPTFRELIVYFLLRDKIHYEFNQLKPVHIFITLDFYFGPFNFSRPIKRKEE